jgi:acyl carrier protein
VKLEENPSVDLVVERLMAILETEREGLSVPREERGEDSIARLHLDSVLIVAFFASVEEEFGIEWDVDIDPDVMRSFDAMAEYLLANGGVTQR